MDKKHFQMAEELAKLPYRVSVRRDEATDGAALFLAGNDELKGCMAQGASIEEALANLEEARIDYLASMLEDGLVIPAPEQTRTVTSGGTHSFEVSIVAGQVERQTYEASEMESNSTRYTLVA